MVDGNLFRRTRRCIVLPTQGIGMRRIDSHLLQDVTVVTTWFCFSRGKLFLDEGAVYGHR